MEEILNDLRVLLAARPVVGSSKNCVASRDKKALERDVKVAVNTDAVSRPCSASTREPDRILKATRSPSQ